MHCLRDKMSKRRVRNPPSFSLEVEECSSFSRNDKFIQELEYAENEIQTFLNEEVVEDEEDAEEEEAEESHVDDYDEDFEEYLDDESSDGSCAYESDFEDDLEDESREGENNLHNEEINPNDRYTHDTIDFRHGIRIKLPSQFAARVANMATEPWSVEYRNSNIRHINLQTKDICCTDIYDFVANVGEKGNEKGKKLDQDILNVPEAFKDCITISIPVAEKDKGNWFDYYARILCCGQWRKIKATYEEEESRAIFSIHSITSFCITRTPTTTAIKITENGYRFNSDHDTLVEVSIPEGAIKTEEKMDFTLYPIDHAGMNWRLKNNPRDCNIMAMSDCLYVHQSLYKFYKPVAVRLPLGMQQGNYQLVFFRWKKDIIEVIDSSANKTIQNTGECGAIMVDSFSGYSAALIRVGSLASISSNEIELNRGTIKLCAILVFVKKNENTIKYFTLWIEIVKKENVKEVVTNREALGLKELPLCKSHDFLLRDEEKIRVEVAGNIKFTPGRSRSSYIVTFLTAAEDNHLSFPVEKFLSASGVPYAIVNFESTKGCKKTVYSAHFNPDAIFVPVRNTPRPCLNMGSFRESQCSSATSSSSNLPQCGNSASHDTLKYAERDKSISEQKQNEAGDNGEKNDPNAGSAETEKKGDAADVDVSSSHGSLNSEQQPENDMFSEQSMINLASVLPLETSFEFGIHLGINSEKLARIRRSSHDNTTEYCFNILKCWLSNATLSVRLPTLLRALRNCEQNTLADIVQETAKKRKCLEKTDLKRI